MLDSSFQVPIYSEAGPRKLFRSLVAVSNKAVSDTEAESLFTELDRQ